jgi:hypothetical protein
MMMEPGPALPDGEVGDRFSVAPDPTTISGLLRASLERPARALVHRLAAPDASAWLQEELSAPPTIQGKTRLEWLRDARAPLDILVEVKESSKRAHKGAGSADALLAARACYFLAIAAALARPGRRITARSAALTHEALVEMGAAVPAEWQPMVELALKRGREMDGAGPISAPRDPDLD